MLTKKSKPVTLMRIFEGEKSIEIVMKLSNMARLDFPPAADWHYCACAGSDTNSKQFSLWFSETQAQGKQDFRKEIS